MVSVLVLSFDAPNEHSNNQKELSFEQKQWIKWRVVHKGFMGLGVLFAIVHMVAHCVRIYWYKYPGPSATLPLGYDYYQTGMGGALFVAITVLCLYYPFRVMGENLSNVKNQTWRRARGAMAAFGARWFRRLHWQLYWLIAVLFALHSYTVTVFLIWVVWCVDYYLHQVPITKVLYVSIASPTSRGQRITCLVVQMSVFSPQGVGSYFQVGLGAGPTRLWASYTAIPVGARAVMFMIAPSSFTAQLDGYLADCNYQLGVTSATEQDMKFLHEIVPLKEALRDPATIVWDLPRRGDFTGVGGVREIPISMYGPYHSNSNDVNNHPRCLVVSSGESGRILSVTT